MFFLVIVEALDLRDIFHFFFDGVGLSTYYKRVMTTNFLATLVSKTYLLLVFFTSLALVSRKLLVLATRYISKRNVSRLSFSGAFFLLFGKSVPLGAPQIDFPGL